MPRLILHDLPGAKRAGELALLVQELFRRGRRVVVWVADDGRRAILDDYLWSFDRHAFVPHVSWDPDHTAADLEQERVVLVGEPANPIGADVLVIGDSLPPGQWLEGFEEVHDLLPPGDAGEQRRRGWRELGLEP